ncbi:MAG: hypothetical protein K9H64_05510 [Bacteroidales bacterium]|nr:hypothetical protein [Bacteroidales bacterium]MCF8455757.1 hypothetical protein [Bacteroidales bacterium]
MKKIYFIVLLIFALQSTGLQLSALSEIEVLEEQIGSQQLTLDEITTQNEDLIKEVTRLKKDKNEKIEIIRLKDQKIVTLAAVITVLSILCLIFFFAYRSVRRRKRIDIAELEEEIARLKQ